LSLSEARAWPWGRDWERLKDESAKDAKDDSWSVPELRVRERWYGRVRKGEERRGGRDKGRT
jgi:hypothetical protein